ncbi:hypothetical protein [Macrococcus bovicus]|uniref:DUF3168 domain-containing protein n=1 Tax=Macrococcus bovicus TaxID=69968 RepID=A0A4R6BXD3_9STAP|nr:hypothetical protein [Macrococcus bovicus]TDM12657.1 hypothetical protein ERX55_10390 [Macrococcus bovicus]
MADWLSAEQPLIRAIMEHLYASPLMSLVDGNIFDKAQVDITGNTYIVIDNTNVLEYPTSTTNKEVIAVTAHIYHKDEAHPEQVVDQTRQFMRWLRFYMQQIEQLPMEHYEVKRASLDLQETITDVDLVTQHGILRIKYEVWHNVRY